jgi:ERF superfamily
VERTEAINELAAALARAQAAIEPAPKDALNPHFNSRFADLASIWEVCRKPLNSNGLSVIQSPEPTDGGGLALRTTLLHSSGQFVASAIPLAYNPASMQSLGSAITYARRYALAAWVGVVTEADDDGNAADAGVSEPASRSKNGHAKSPNSPRMNGLEVPPWGRFGVPRQGKQLFMWAKDHGIVNEVQSIGKELGFAERMTVWDEVGVDVVARHLDALRSGDAPLQVIAG